MSLFWLYNYFYKEHSAEGLTNNNFAKIFHFSIRYKRDIHYVMTYNTDKQNVEFKYYTCYHFSKESFDKCNMHEIKQLLFWTNLLENWLYSNSKKSDKTCQLWIIFHIQFHYLFIKKSIEWLHFPFVFYLSIFCHCNF